MCSGEQENCYRAEQLVDSFSSHTYGKRLTSDSSWEFLKIENMRIKLNSPEQFLCTKLTWKFFFGEEIEKKKTIRD